MSGHAGPALLATYERSAGRSGGSPSSRPTPDTSPARRPTSAPPTASPSLPDLEIELGYVYRSPAVSSGDDSDGGDLSAVHGDPRESRGRPGSRAPHLWIDGDGRRQSTLDLLGATSSC